MLVPRINWIKFDRFNPPTNLHSDEEYLILLREDCYRNNVKIWTYSVDVATPYGSYLDDFWDTETDWVEGQPIEVLAYAELPYGLSESDLIEVNF